MGGRTNPVGTKKMAVLIRSGAIEANLINMPPPNEGPIKVAFSIFNSYRKKSPSFTKGMNQYH